MPARPPITHRDDYEHRLGALRAREKAHTSEGDAIAAARRRLPMVQVDASTELTAASGPVTLLDAFDGRSQLFAYFHMWHDGCAAPEQCEGCTFFNGHVQELSYLHSRDVSFATLCDGPFAESDRYRGFMGYAMPWYAVPEASVAPLLGDRGFGMSACYLRDGDRVYET